MMVRPCLKHFVGLLLATLLARAAAAQQVTTDPASTHIFPAGGQRGSRMDVRVGGECLPPGTRLRFFGEGVTAAALLEERAAANHAPSVRRKPGELHINYPKEWKSHLEIAADAALGARLWRLSCARGGTGGRLFIVGDLPETIEAEPNSTPDLAEPVAMPVTINGQICGERDLDYFRFTATAGDIVRADVVAARLGSQLDAVVEFFGPDGRRVQAEEVRAGADPVLAFRVAVSGEYRLSIANINYHGNPAHVYRLTLSTAPYVRSAFPPGGQAGTTKEMDLLALAGNGDSRLLRTSVTFGAGVGETWWADPSLGMNAIALAVDDLPGVVESTGNDTRETAQELAWPTIVYGQFEAAADEDWFRLPLRAGVPISVECAATPRGSPVLPIVTLTDANGGPIAQGNAVHHARGLARFEWTPPADMDCRLRVRDLQHGVRGGDDFVYRLAIRQAQPDFLLFAKADAVNVLQGGRGELEISVERRGGFAGPIELSAAGLPDGVKLEGQQIAAGQEAAKLAFVADPEARSQDMTLKITGRGLLAADKPDSAVERPLLATHLGHDADGVGVGPVAADHVQLTVMHKPVFKLACNEAYQYAHRGTIYPYLMEIERLDGFNGPIRLQVADRQNKDLDGIEVIETTVPGGDSQVMLPLYLPETMHINAQAHSNVYAQGHVDFVDKFGQRQSLLVVSTMRCMVRTLPTVVRLRAAESAATAQPGQPLVVRLELDRTPNFSGPMRVELIEPRDVGFSAEPVTIAEGETAATVVVNIAQSVSNPRRTLKFRAVGRMDDSVQVISEATLQVRLP